MSKSKNQNEVSTFYDTDAAEYDERWRKRGGIKTAQSQGFIVDEITKDWRQKNIIEVGCGTGRFTTLVAPKGRFTVQLDIAIRMLGVTRSKMLRVSQHFMGTNSSAYEMPFDKQVFDAAYSINVFNHLEKPIIALAEVNRILKINGLFLVNFSNLYSYFWPIAAYINHGHKSVGRNVYSVWYTLKEMREILHNAGFVIEKTMGNVYVPLYLDYPVIREMPIALDAISRRSILKWISPSVFFLCRKNKSFI